MTDSVPCARCGKPYWWHLQINSARGDDGHLYIVASRLRAGVKFQEFKRKKKAKRAEKQFLTLTKDMA